MAFLLAKQSILFFEFGHKLIKVIVIICRNTNQLCDSTRNSAELVFCSIGNLSSSLTISLSIHCRQSCDLHIDGASTVDMGMGRYSVGFPLILMTLNFICFFLIPFFLIF